MCVWGAAPPQRLRQDSDRPPFRGPSSLALVLADRLEPLAVPCSADPLADRLEHDAPQHVRWYDQSAP
jgi:hypothetical protein